jgi:Protein of unknown function (DUF4229)
VTVIQRYPVLAFTVLRVLLFVLVLGICYVLGLRQLLLFVVAILVSGLVSLPLLARQRAAVADRVGERSARARARLDEAAHTDDLDEDA